MYGRSTPTENERAQPLFSDAKLTRRKLIRAGLIAALVPAAFAQPTDPRLEIVTAPSNLGLRPPSPGHEPGTWKAPDAYRKAGLFDRLAPHQVHSIKRPSYNFESEVGTRIRNAHEIRAFSESLAEPVANILQRNVFPLVLGGDCSILLGCLLGVRRGGTCGLVHVDGHSDFVHPGNSDPVSKFGTVAGMDLALASGRGEPLLTDWGPGLTPLVADEHIVQIGEREDTDPHYSYPDIRQTRIHRIDVRSAQRSGMQATAERANGYLATEHLSRVWLHVDVDVLDENIMPAVDSPGTPGLTYGQLAALIQGLRASRRIIGADISVFDPELDPDGRYARGLTESLALAFGPLPLHKLSE